MTLNSTQSKEKIFIVFIMLLGFISLIIPPINSYLSYRAGKLNNMFISWIPNFFILTAAYLIRFGLHRYLKRAEKELANSNPIKEFPLKSRRFTDFIFLSMNTGTAATLVIYLNFLAGAFIYLIMHIFLIIAFSGIIHLNFKALFEDKKLFIYSIFTLIFWMTLSPLLYFIFAYPHEKSLVLMPYAFILGSMAAISSIGLFYQKRPLTFRLMIMAGALFFVTSDLFIAAIGPNLQKTNLIYFVNPTYVMAIFLLSYSSLTAVKLQSIKRKIQVIREI